MNARVALSMALAMAALGHATASNADPGAEGEIADPLPPIIAAIDFDTIPSGTLPRVPGEADVPASTPDERAKGLKLVKVKNPFGKKTPNGLIAKMGKTELVELLPEHPEITAMYVPTPDGTDFEGETISRMACRRKDPLSPVRWETFTMGADGNGKLEIKDLWFDSETCSMSSGSTSEVGFKAIAWDGAKPWLFAMRDDKSVTFLMPRANDVNADAMVGAVTTVRGGFTRVTLPIGRWGSSSLVASLASLRLKAPPPAPPKAHAGTQSVEEESAEPDPNDQPVEIAVELVQTMSEKSPTLLVRRSQPEGDGTTVVSID